MLQVSSLVFGGHGHAQRRRNGGAGVTYAKSVKFAFLTRWKP